MIDTQLQVILLYYFIAFESSKDKLCSKDERVIILLSRV